MSNQISSQASKVWKTVSDPATVDTYKQAGNLTLAILRETGILLWLIICLGLVAFDWFWANSIAAGQRTRTWVNNLGAQGTQGMAVEARKTIVSVSKTGLASAIAQAREQLGLPEKQQPVLEEPVATSSTTQSSNAQLESMATTTMTASGPAAPATPVESTKPAIPVEFETTPPSVVAEVTPATPPQETQDDLL
jgi:hypothetical protein